jgi:hypothetical protein
MQAGLALPDVRIDPSAIKAALSQSTPLIDNEELNPAAGRDGDKVCRAGSTGTAGVVSDGSARGVAVPSLLLDAAKMLLACLGLRGLQLPPSLLSWHSTQQVLAVGHASTEAVLVYDLAAASSADTAAVHSGKAGTASLPPPLTAPRNVLSHQLQRCVCSLAWRPVHCSMLAVGCDGGVALWSLGKQQPPAAGGSSCGGA